MKSRILVVLALIAGTTAGFANTGYSKVDGAAGNQQCYYRPGIDADNSCNTCSSTCLGSGYLCCGIVVNPT